MGFDGKRVRIQLDNTFRYGGPVLEDNDQFLIIFDERSGSQFAFNKKNILSIEVLE